MPFLCVHMQSFPQMFSMTTVDTPNILSSIHHSLVEATFKQRSWFVWLLLSSDQICNTAGFFPLCNYPMLVMNCYVENIQSHFLPPLLHTSCKRLGYPRWATLWAIIIWARDAGTAMKLKWTDEQTFINGTLSLSLVACTTTEELMEESITSSGYPPLQDCNLNARDHGAVWRSED